MVAQGQSNVKSSGTSGRVGRYLAQTCLMKIISRRKYPQCNIWKFISEVDDSRVGINKDDHLLLVSSEAILYIYVLHAGVETTGAGHEPYHGETAI